MSIFNNIDYRKSLRQCIAEKKKLSKKYTLQSIARYMTIQTPFLSKVLNGHSHFSSDQLWSIMEYLDLALNEKNYLKLCLEYERSGLAKRKKILLNEIENIQAENLETSEHIETESLAEQITNQAEYYLDPLNLIVHMSLNLERYQNSLEKLAKDLGRPLFQIQNCVQKLIDLEIIKIEKNKYINTKKNYHLAKTSNIFKPHQSLLRQTVLEHLMRNSEQKEYYNLAITYTADEKHRKLIHQEFLTFLKKADSIIDQAPSKNVYQMNFDLFPWLKKS